MYALCLMLIFLFIPVIFHFCFASLSWCVSVHAFTSGRKSFMFFIIVSNINIVAYRFGEGKKHQSLSLCRQKSPIGSRHPAWSGRNARDGGGSARWLTLKCYHLQARVESTSWTDVLEPPASPPQPPPLKNSWAFLGGEQSAPCHTYPRAGSVGQNKNKKLKTQSDKQRHRQYGHLAHR